MSDKIAELNEKLVVIEDGKLNIKRESKEIDERKNDLQQFVTKLTSAYDYVAEGYQGNTASVFLLEQDGQIKNAMSTTLCTLNEKQEKLEHEVKKLSYKEDDIHQKKMYIVREQDGNDIWCIRNAYYDG